MALPIFAQTIQIHNKTYFVGYVGSLNQEITNHDSSRRVKSDKKNLFTIITNKIVMPVFLKKNMGHD